MRNIQTALETGHFETDKNTIHSYGPIYDALFAHLFDKPINLLEIGIWKGGSAALWQHVFPKGKFLFIEREHQLEAKFRLDWQRADYWLCDAYNEKTVAAINRCFDIIIDDGNHTYEQQIFVVQHYSRLLVPGGILIVEDVQDEKRLEDLKAAVPADLVGWHIDLRHVKKRYDDLLFIVQKLL